METQAVKTWTEEPEKVLRDCFDSTVWEELCVSHGEDINSFTGCVMDYINLCVDNTVPTGTVRCFQTAHDPDMKALLKEKKSALRSGNKEELKAVQKELRKKIREGKNSYRREMENQLQQRNVSGVWKSLKTISGQRTPDSQAEGDQTWVICEGEVLQVLPSCCCRTVQPALLPIDLILYSALCNMFVQNSFLFLR